MIKVKYPFQPIVTDGMIEKCGVHYTRMDVYKKYGITFERFVHLVVNNIWLKHYVNAG
jgi:hypothetical protein